jgi:hypothetical protein
MEEMDPVVKQEVDGEAKPELEPSHWYEGHISLEDAKTFIKSNITTAARSFIAIGFYLKCVRDRGLFTEDNYQDVWDFAKSEYGISKSTASRYMSMNDRFSENGNSPNIKTEYKAFGKSQLQEMLYLEDEQLEQVKPGDRVEDIRNLRRQKEIPYIELPGQMDFEIDFPDILPPDQIEQPVMSQKQTFEINVVDLLSGEEQESVAISQQDADANSKDFEDKRKEEWLIRCEVLRQMCNALCDMHSYGLEKDNYSMTAIQRISSGSYGFGFGDDGSGRSKYNVEYKESRYHVEEFDGIGSWVFESGEIDQDIWNYNGRDWHNAHPVPQNQETSQIEDIGYYNPDDEKEIDESYSYAGIPKASDRYVTMFARLFVQDNANRLIYGGMAIGITDERIIEMLKLRYFARKGDPIIIDNDVEVSVAAEIIEFYRGEEDLGICLFQKFSNYVRKQIDGYVEKQMSEENTEGNQENVIEQPGSIPESSKSVIDGEYEEVPSEPETQEYTPRYFLEEQKEKLNNYLRIANVKELLPAEVKTIECQKTIVAALACMVAELEKPEPEPENVKQDQPELPILKNNDQRAAFIDSYETWPIWIETKETGERYYRYDLTDGTSMVVKVYHAQLFDYKATGKKYEDRYYEGYGKHEYYYLNDGKFFRDCETNRSYLIERLKELQKKVKGD